MATASSAQREPSMEEILASIRRIIEDSDSGRKPDDAQELRQDLEPLQTGKSKLEEAPPEVDAFRSELRSQPETKKPVTLAEVQATLSSPAIARMEPPVRRESGFSKPTPIPAEADVQFAAEPARSPMPEPLAKTQQPEVAEADIAKWQQAINAVEEIAKPDSVAGQGMLDTLRQPDVEIFEEDLTVEAEPASVEPQMAGRAVSDSSASRPAIVSERTGRQVAAAFGELSDAFASRSKKTFDEMAKEMLRPMLQDWLDNNLPTLVERLVREEIERVARGAQ